MGVGEPTMGRPGPLTSVVPQALEVLQIGELKDGISIKLSSSLRAEGLVGRVSCRLTIEHSAGQK